MSKPRKLPSKKWQARYYVTEGNRLVSRSAGTFVTKRDAQDAIDVELAKIRTGRWIDPLKSEIAVKDWAEKWYAARQPSKKVRSFLDAQIVPRWGEWEIGQIENLHVKLWVRDLASSRAPETVKAVYSTFAAMLTDAVHADHLLKSPCWGAQRDGLPPVVRTKLHYLDAEQGRRLIALAPARYRAMFHLALWTGMRWGELAALRWESVDLSGDVITVMEAAKRDGTVGATKTGKAREVVVDPSTTEVLRAHRRDFGGHDLVFTTERGAQLDYPVFRRRVFVPLAEVLEVDWPLTFHTLRHTYVSTLLESGVDALVVAKYAGHSRASFTTDRYGHARHDAAEVVREAIERAMRR